MKFPSYLLFLWFFQISYFTGTSQNNTDSLLQAIEQGQADTILVELYSEILRKYYKTNQFEEMLAKAEEMLTYFEEKNYKEGALSALLYKGLALDILGESKEAILLFDKGTKMCYELGDSLLATKYLFNKGVVHQRQGEWDLALSDYLDVYQLYSQFDEKDKLSRLLNNIAIIYRYQEAYDKAIAAYDESLELKRVILDSAGIAATLMNMGILYSYTDEMETAVNHLREAKVLYQNLGQVAGLAECTNALGVIYYNLGRFPEAKEQFNIANQYYKENPFPWAQAGTLFSLGSIALVEKEYALSEEYLKKAIEMSEKANRWGEKFDVFLKLSQAQHALGKNREAYQALQIAYELQDSIKEDRKMQLIEENQAHFEVLQKEKALAINQLALEKSNRERNSLIWGILLLFLLGIGLVLFFYQRIRIGKQKTALQQQRIQQLEQEKQLAALNAVVEGEEKERLRIAADLHDGLGGLLTAIKFHFSQLLKSTQKAVLFDKTNSLIDEACSEVRRISHNMAPRALALSNLTGALENLGLLIKAQGLDCELEIIGIDESKLQEKAVGIYRIIQELCNNSLKHADAKQLFIQLFQKNGALSILIEDDGKGFDYAQAIRKEGLGLSSIESRVKVLNGAVDWDSVIGEGTTVNISIPIPN